MSFIFLLAGYRQRRGGDCRWHCLLPFLSHSLGLDDQSFWLAASIARSFLQWLPPRRPAFCVRRSLRFNCCTAGDETFSARSGSVVAWYFDFGFAGFVIAW